MTPAALRVTARWIHDASMDMSSTRCWCCRSAVPKSPKTFGRSSRTSLAVRGVPPERLDAVVEHYMHFGGVSPINALNRDIIERGRRPSSQQPASTCRCTSATATGTRWSRTPSRRCARTVSAIALVFADVGVGRLFRMPAVPRGHRRAREAVGDDAPTLHKIRQYYDHPLDGRARSPTAVRRPRAELPERASRQRAPGVHRAFGSDVPPTAMQGRRQMAATSTADRLPRLRSLVAEAARRRRIRSGVAVAIRPAAGSVARPRHL